MSEYINKNLFYNKNASYYSLICVCLSYWRNLIYIQLSNVLTVLKITCLETVREHTKINKGEVLIFVLI